MTLTTFKMTASQFRQMGQDPSGVRLELVDGEIAVSPSPTPAHSYAIVELTFLLKFHLEQSHAGVLLHDCDTIFGENDVRRPDMLFYIEARQGLIGDKKLEGVPDLAVEVISEGSERTDKAEKFQQYAKGGVKYYWIVDPLDHTFEAYTLKRGRYSMTARGSRDDSITPAPFPKLVLPLRKLWWPRR